MVRAVECVVEGVVEDSGGVLVPVLTNHQKVLHTRQLRRDTDFGLEPTLRDPYESSMVEIRVSNIDGANQGLFARQDIEINRVLAFYNNTLTSFIPWTPTILVDCWSLKHIGASFNDPLSVDIDMVSTAKNINGIFNSIYLLHFWALRII